MSRKGAGVGVAVALAVIAFLVLASTKGVVAIVAAAYFCVFLIAFPIGLILVLIGAWRRTADTAENQTGEGSRVEIEPNIGGLGLAIAAAVLAIVSVFLPALETTAFSHIEKNTMIQNGAGWLVVGSAIGIIGATYRVYSKRTTTWSVFVLGVAVLGGAIYDGTGSRTKLESVVSFGGESIKAHGSPAVGLYAAGAAGLIAAFAGLILAGHVFDSYRGPDRRTKTCPDCAETVLAAARVCKHCGHSFDATAIV